MKLGKKPPVRVFLPRSAVLLLASLFLLLLLLHSPLEAAGLIEVYRQAQVSDPAFEAARHALEAVRQRIPQARAGLLPTVALSGSNSRNRSDVDFGQSAPAQDRDIRSWNWTLQLTQPLLRMQNRYAYDEAEFLAGQAQAQFDAAEQELILRVTQAYFDVTAAEESIAVADAQLRAMNEQLAIAQRGFKNGTATITDTHEAKSRVGLARADRVAALNERETKRAELEKIAGELPPSLAVLRPGIVAPMPQPDDAREWIGQARENHPQVRAQEAALAASEAAVRKHRAEHLPTLDLVASHGRNKSSGSLDTPTDYSTSARSNVIGLQLSIPLYAGGAVSARVAEAIAGLYNGASMIEALATAVESGESAVEGNRVGYRLGIRINIDVLNAEQQLYAARRDRTRARYDTLLQGLKLKAAAGVLSENDLEAIDRMLGPGE